jgi:hypothetical protein
MHGLRVVPIFRYPPSILTEAERSIKPSRRLLAIDGSDFALYFGGILPALGGLVWLADERAFQFPLDWEDEPYREVARRRTWIAQQGDGHTTLTVDPNWILGPGFVADYARYVNDDWNTLYGFATAPDDWRAWMRRRFEGEAEERAAFLASTLELAFFSVDGAYWEFHATDGRLVERARRDLRGLAGLRLESARLDESIGI